VLVLAAVEYGQLREKEMSASDQRQPVSVALRTLIARADALPAGEVVPHVQACAHALAAACTSRAGVGAAVDRMDRSLTQLEVELSAGTRRRHQHDTPAVQRLAETLRNELVPSLRLRRLL
jgi:hypothetical protein